MDALAVLYTNSGSTTLLFLESVHVVRKAPTSRMFHDLRRNRSISKSRFAKRRATVSPKGELKIEIQMPAAQHLIFLSK